MRIKSIFSMVILAGWCAVLPTQVWAGLVFGPSARTQFESYKTSVGDTLLDFNSLALNTNLTNQLSGLGVTFSSNIYVDGTPFGPVHVQVSAASGRANTIVGSPCDGGCTDDGRVGYQILFASPQRRAGLMRNWNTQTLTQFYNASGALLAQHVNTTGSEFVGFIAVGTNPITDWVSRIQIDTVAPANNRQVGYSDDLFFGTAAPPDTQAPSVAGGPAATAASSSQINFAWTASTDNVGVTAYKVYRGGTLIATLGNVTSYSDSGLTSATTYSYTVQACDAVGNCSAQSASASATTPSAFTANLEPGFNLIGNSLNPSIDVVSTFGNQDSKIMGITDDIASVWKWDAANLKWHFHSPLLTAATNASYAASHNYDVLTSIAAGEGYWINALSAITLPAQTGTAFNWNGFTFANLPSGFNLIAHAANVTPSQFNANVSVVPPSPGIIPTDNFSTLWAWDATNVTWFFYSPLLEASGGLVAVKPYADSHSFQHFQDFNKKIEIGVGFWVNKF